MLFSPDPRRERLVPLRHVPAGCLGRGSPLPTHEKRSSMVQSSIQLAVDFLSGSRFMTNESSPFTVSVYPSQCFHLSLQ